MNGAGFGDGLDDGSELDDGNTRGRSGSEVSSDSLSRILFLKINNSFSFALYDVYHCIIIGMM